jgi:hypothetical protein
LGASVIPAAISWALRPQAISMLLFAAICWVLAGGRRLVWIPVLVVVWINCHGAAVMSLVAIAGAGTAASVAARRIVWPFAWTFAASVLATGLSPVGFRMYPEILASMERSRINQLIEWLPPGAAPWLWPFWAVAAVVPITLVARARHMDERAARHRRALAVLPLAVRSTRNVHLFLLAAAPAITSAWAGTSAVPARLVPERERVNGAILLSVAAAAAIFVAVAWIHPLPHSGWQPIGADAARAVEACDGPLYNTYGDGGVFIWFTPDRPVFIDNRQDPFPDDLLRLNKALESDGRYEAAFARYGIRCAALPPTSPIAQRLLTDPAWSTTHRDRRWIILARATPTAARQDDRENHDGRLNAAQRRRNRKAAVSQ